MENNTSENSKKTSAMEKASLSGKMVESTKVAGSEANSLALATTRTIMERGRKESGWMENVKNGSILEQSKMTGLNEYKANV